ncbi:putative RNA-directed DNA polymerase from transposon BS [Labeo rohita]|uniref:RNA-directed DNA polymerase from transposon BS n=1 Tax=Labeo rohita TaxID=84645 RepID=A0ABQ8L514_LABRO|nr:putative RNA-directed DNA polymerase from transposon BS [Labeo rohita]
MAPRMAASVLSSPVVLVFLLVFPVFCFANTISFTRDELLNIRQYTPQNLLPDLNYSDVLLKVVVGGAAALIKRFRTRRRGEASRRAREASTTRIPNGTAQHTSGESTLSTQQNRRTPLARLNDAIPDCALHLPGYQLFRADGDAESTGKSRGGGTCFYINERWCTDVTVLKKMCCSDLEALFIDFYIPPQAHVSLALQKLADQIADMEQKHPDSVLIILGDFNKANLSRELPKYSQHATCPTRDSNILDHCYTTIKNAYHSVPWAALGLSDHCLVHLIPSYRQKLKSAKPVVKSVKRWTNETERVLQACFELTDWSVFEAAANDLDELTETNNDKPWFTAKLRQLRQAKEDAYRYGDKVLYKQAKYTLEKEIRVAKRNYSKRLRNQFYSSDSSSVWKGLKVITNYKTPSPNTVENQQLADDLNEFYCRFEKTPLTPPTTLLSPTPALQIREDDVRQVFRKNKRRKAPGPDGVTSTCLKTCADQLAPIFSQIFNRSLELCEVPSCFKRSTIIPVPKKPKITGLNDYRPVALTSVIMKSFEKLVLAYLKDITGPLLEPLQFAYRANRSVDDAVNMGLHFILQHLKSGTYVRILFVDFSSAFNTIIPNLLLQKLTQLSVPTSICQWITSFLTERQQLVKLRKYSSSTRTISTGTPQGCVLSPLLFSLYTNDCTSKDPSVKLLKFADDTTIIGLIQDGDESAYRQEVKELAVWCSHNNLELNTLKTVEMTGDFRKHPPALPPLTIMDSTVMTVETFRFLGNTISQDLKWDIHIDATVKKAQQRLFFLRQLRKFNLPQELLKQFYTAIIESVLCTSITVRFSSATKSDLRRLHRTVWTAERIIGTTLPTLQELYLSRVSKKAGKITRDPSHPAHSLFELLPSGRRYRALSTRTARHRNSFFPQAIHLMNTSQ